MAIRLHDKRELDSRSFHIHNFETGLLGSAEEHAVYNAFRRLSHLPENSIVCATNKIVYGFAAGSSSPYQASLDACDSIRESLTVWGEEPPDSGMVAAFNFRADKANYMALAGYGVTVLFSTVQIYDDVRDRFFRDWIGVQNRPQGPWIMPRTYIEPKWNLNEAKERKYTEKYGAP
jgi:hypothetical protein